MELIQDWPPRKSLFIFDLEFIGDVRKLNTCRIWEVAIFSLTSQQWFEAVIDPDPTMEEFPPPPIPEIPQLTREFLKTSGALTWDIVFQQLCQWVHVHSMGCAPVFISHNTFRADKPILELECKRYNVPLPLQWYFFDSLHFSRRVMKNSTGNYSLSGLHEQLFNGPIENAHRARADVVACTKIMSSITNGKWELQGPIYPSYSTALRTIRWIGQKAEELLYKENIRSVEELYTIIQRNARKDMIEKYYSYEASVMETLTNVIKNDLPQDNIRNIAAVISENPQFMSYTFVAAH